MNYVTYHLHSDRSLLDSCTHYKDYIDKAVELGQPAICFTEHGRVLNWVAKKLYCAEKGIKYIHGVEIYLTETLEEKVRDNYHTILIAKNYEGVKEINSLLTLSEQPDHFYYKNRITFDEFLNISDNIISTSACLAGPLNKLHISHPYYERLAEKYTYYEIQPHNHPEQIAYNQLLKMLARKYRKPLIAGTDTHSLNDYKAECRSILQKAKHIAYADEDSFDLTYKSYDELVDAFRRQNCFEENVYTEAIRNTVVMAESVEDFELDTTFKYPMLYGSYEQDAEVYEKRVAEKFAEKVKTGVIPQDQIINFQKAIDEESAVFEQINMKGFMLSMSEFVCWCKENGIPIGYNRGSCGGSRIAYILDITDMNPETWHTVFSRFANSSRKEIGDIDIDASPDDRDKIYKYIIDRFGQDRAAYILAIGTISDKGTIDEIGRALAERWKDEHEGASNEINPYSLKVIKEVKALYETDEEAARKKYPNIFYYFDGMVNTAISQSMHPAGIVVSPISLPDNYGYLTKEDKSILQIDMEEIHEISLVKYDILGLKNVQIIRDCCKLAGIPYPKSHEINWCDEAVWTDMLRSPVGIFQFESAFAFQSLCKMKPKSIEDMSLVTAAIRPSGTSYRDSLLRREINKNPSKIIDDMLEKNLGFLVYQEDTIKFLQEVCGLTGSEADNIRRAIGRKDKERLDKALPQILEGYCSKSSSPREVAETEAKAFLKIIEDSASYQFGYNHSIGYCLIGYTCAYLRHYYPYEFITAFLNNADNDEDIANGASLCKEYGIRLTSPRFGVSRDDYTFDKNGKIIAMGVSAIKFLSKKIANQLYKTYQNNRLDTFVDVLYAITEQTEIDTRQRDILIHTDYFAEFGEMGKLIEVAKAFDYFKSGKAKKVSKEKECPYIKFVAAYGSDKNAKGAELKAFTITDCKGLLKAIEHDIAESSKTVITYADRVAWQMEYLNSIQGSGKPEDRWKIYIKELRPACRKADGKQFGYNINYISLGSGKSGTATIFNKNFKEGTKVGSVLQTSQSGWSRNGKYFNLDRYSLI